MTLEEFVELTPVTVLGVTTDPAAPHETAVTMRQEYQ